MSPASTTFLGKLRPTGVREMVDGADCGIVHDPESIREYVDAALYQGMVSYGTQGDKSVLLAKVARLQRRTAEFAESTKAYDASLQRPQARVASSLAAVPGLNKPVSACPTSSARTTGPGVEGSLLLPYGEGGPAAVAALLPADFCSLPGTLHALLCEQLPAVLASHLLAPQTSSVSTLPPVPLLGFQPTLAEPLRSDALQALTSLCVGCSPVGCRHDQLDLFSAEELGLLPQSKGIRYVVKKGSTGSSGSGRSLHCTQLAALGCLSVPLLRSSVPGAPTATLPSLVAQALRSSSGANNSSAVVVSLLACAQTADKSSCNNESGSSAGVNLLSSLLARLLHSTPFDAPAWAAYHLPPRAQAQWSAFRAGDEAACLLFIGSFLQLVTHVKKVATGVGSVGNSESQTGKTELLSETVSLAVAARAVHAAFRVEADVSDLHMIEAQAESCVLSLGSTGRDKQEPDMLTALNELLGMVGMGLTGSTLPGGEPAAATVLLQLPSGPAPSGGAFLRGAHGGTMHVRAVLADLASVPVAPLDNSLGARSRYSQEIPDYTHVDDEQDGEGELGESVADLGQRRLMFYKAADFEVKRDGILLPPRFSSRQVAPSASVPRSRFHGSDGRLRHCLEVADPESYALALQQLLARTREERIRLGWDEEKEKREQRRQTRKDTRVARQQAIISSYLNQTSSVSAADSVAAMAMMDESGSDHSSDGHSSDEESVVLPAVSASAAQSATMTLYDLQRQLKHQKNKQNQQSRGAQKQKPKAHPLEAEWPALFTAAPLPSGTPLPPELWPHVLSGAAGGMQVNPVLLAVRLLPLHLLQRRRVCQMIRLNQLWYASNPHGSAVLGRGPWLTLVESLKAESGNNSMDMVEAERRWLRAVDGGSGSSDGGMTFAAFATEVNLLAEEGLLDHKTQS